MSGTAEIQQERTAQELNETILTLLLCYCLPSHTVFLFHWKQPFFLAQPELDLDKSLLISVFSNYCARHKLQSLSTEKQWGHKHAGRSESDQVRSTSESVSGKEGVWALQPDQAGHTAHLRLFKDISGDGVKVSQVFDGGDVF